MSALLLKVDVGDPSGSALLVEVDREEVPGGLVRASPDPGRAAAEAAWTVYQSLERLTPLLSALQDKLVAAGPDTTTVEFGVKFGGETGIILAKGSAEVHLKVTMHWNNSSSS